MVCHDVVVCCEPSGDQHKVQEPQVPEPIQCHHNSCDVAAQRCDVPRATDGDGICFLQLRADCIRCCEAAHEVADACCQLDCQHGAGGCQEGEERPVVFGAYAVVDPLAVVVKAQHALLALLAVPAASLYKCLHMQTRVRAQSAGL